ncbi:MAG: competence protein CoiA family protein [Snowella sp.]|nr:competence protein CoiA family protein [Snowella sp.]
MVKLMHGLTKDKILVSVKNENIESGLRCQCFCPACGESLVAKKGKVINWHFARYSKIECEYAFETAIHYIAKDIIKEKGLCLPTLTIMEYFNRNSSELDYAERLHLL